MCPFGLKGTPPICEVPIFLRRLFNVCSSLLVLGVGLTEHEAAVETGSLGFKDGHECRGSAFLVHIIFCY